MKPTFSEQVENGRIVEGRWRSHRGEPLGVFRIFGPCGEWLVIVASNGIGWDHVSVSIRRRLPNWLEMSFVKDLFWSPEEAAVQFHPPRSQYVNNHSNCLHLWRPQQDTMTLPPHYLVGVASAGVLKSEADAMTALAELVGELRAQAGKTSNSLSETENEGLRRKVESSTGRTFR